MIQIQSTKKNTSHNTFQFHGKTFKKGNDQIYVYVIDF